MFSFYASEGCRIEDQRGEVMERMAAMVSLAVSADVVLLHENEKAIYGAKPEGVKDLLAVMGPGRLKGIFDPANYVEEGVAPYDEAWCGGLAELTDYFHVKDKIPGQNTCVPAGDGSGQLAEIFADVPARGWSGFATLEPHLAKAGQFAGFTGRELFARAAEAFKRVCEEAGVEYN